MNKARYLVLRISLALGSVTFACVATFIELGVLPNPAISTRNAHSKMCETLGASLSLGPIQQGVTVTQQHLELFHKRNPQALSLGLRQDHGSVVAKVGDHASRWNEASADHPETCFVVPIVRGGQLWGRLEVIFESEKPWHGLSALPSWFTPAVSISFCVFALAWLSLARILRHLDPSRVVPSRVRETLDNFAEGVLLLDKDERIVLANRAFAENIGASSESLTGRLARDLGWQADSKDAMAFLPWEGVTKTEKPVRSMALQLETSSGRQHYSVNAVPVVDDQGSLRGTMAAFADITELESKKQGLAEAMQQLSASHQDIAKKNKELEFLATRDPLTGCLNRRSLFESFEKNWDFAKRKGSGLSCIMVDIDFFKSINDNYGHQKGDEVLRATGGLLVEMARKYDLPSRYGGEEFCIVLPGAKIEEAEGVAERIRTRLGEIDFGEFQITASLGVSAIELGAPDPQGLIDQADKCLYVAKRNGRNQTVRFDEIDANIEVDESKISRTKPEQEVAETTTGDDLPYRCVSALLSTLAYRDPETAAHSMRVADLSVAIGRQFLSPRDAYHLEVAALLHDIGKIGVPDAILLKPGPLDDEEWIIMHRHDRFGVEIVNASFGFEPVTEIVRDHHARYERDGQEQIPLGARIVCIADAFDAMTNDRPYRKGMTTAEACAELSRCAGKQFDPKLVEALCVIVGSEDWQATYKPRGVTQEAALSVGRQLEQLVNVFGAEDSAAVASLSKRLSQTARQASIDDLADAADELSRLSEEDAELHEIVESVHDLLRLGNSLHASVLDNVASSYA